MTQTTIPTRPSGPARGSDSSVAELAEARCTVGLLTAISVSLFLTMLPVTMLVPVLRELVADRFGASTFWTHSFMSINMIGAVLAAPLGGMLADRVGKRKPILIAALAADAVLLWLMLHAGSLAGLLAVRFFEGAAHILAVTTLMALASDWAPADRRGRVMGIIGGALIFGTACGPMLGGRIVHLASGATVVFQVGAGLATASAIVGWLFVRDSAVRGRGVRLSMDLLREHREMLVPYAYAFIDRFCVGVIVSTFVLYLSECVGLSPQQRGGLLAMFLIPFALLCYPAGRLADRIGRTIPLCVGSVAFGVIYASYGFLPAGWLPAAMVVSGVLSALMFSPNLAMCCDLAPGEHRAAAYAGFNVAGSLGFIAGPLVGGTICTMLASASEPGFVYRAALAVAGATEVLCVAVTLPRLLALRRSGRTT